MNQTEIDKITQLLKTGECSNQILAIQLAVGLGLSIDEIVELCLCLEEVVYLNDTTELILCDYGISHTRQYDYTNKGDEINHIDSWSLTARSEFLPEFNDYVKVDEVQPIKLKLLKAIIESVI